MRRLAPLRCTSPRAAGLSRAQNRHNPAPLLSRCDTLASSTPPVPSTRTHQNSSKTMFLFLGRTHTRDTSCFSSETFTQTEIPEELPSPAQSISVITTTEPCGVPSIPRTSRLQTNNYVACRIPNQISQQTLDIVSRVVAVADMSGTIDKLFFDVQTIQATFCDGAVQSRPG